MKNQLAKLGTSSHTVTVKLLSGPHQKFCEGIVSGLNETDAYAAAYPNASPEAAMSAGSRLFRNVKIQAEITRMRSLVANMPGVLTLAEKRTWLARLLRVNLAKIDTDKDGDLLSAHKPVEFGVEIKLHDKIAAISKDNDLAAHGSEAQANDGLREMLARVCALK